MSASSKAVRQGHLPFLNELGFSFAQILVLLTGIVVAVVSFISGGNIVAIALRTGVAILAVGLIGWLFNWILVGGGSAPRGKNETGTSDESANAGANPAHTIEKSV